MSGKHHSLCSDVFDQKGSKLPIIRRPGTLTEKILISV